MSDSDRIATLVATTYDTETFRPTLGEVRRRARGRLRRRLPAFLAALALLLLGGGTAVVVAGGGTGPNPDCEAQWAAAGRLGTMPPSVLSVGDRPGITVYAKDSTEFDCVHGKPGQVDSLIYDRPLGPALAVTGIAADGSWAVYTGVTLPGTTAVKLHDPVSNRTYNAVVNGIHFGVELPYGSASDTLISATGPFGVTVTYGPVLHSVPPGVPYVSCPDESTDTPALAGIDTTSPPVVIDLTPPRVGGVTRVGKVALAGSDRTVVLCGFGFSEGFYAQDRPGISPFTVYGTIAQPDTWVLGGRVPADTTSVTVVMTDGTQIAATVRDGFWLASNPDASANGPTPVLATAISPTGIDRHHLGG